MVKEGPREKFRGLFSFLGSFNFKRSINLFQTNMKITCTNFDNLEMGKEKLKSFKDASTDEI